MAKHAFSSIIAPIIPSYQFDYRRDRLLEAFRIFHIGQLLYIKRLDAHLEHSNCRHTDIVVEDAMVEGIAKIASNSPLALLLQIQY